MARAVFGAPLHNGARHLPEALESLLAQSHDDLALVLFDDASVDDTPSIARRYAEADARVTYERSAARQGLIGSWGSVLELARERHPEAEYFAWASDHDVWDPHWLASMVERLDANPAAVLAYPLSVRIGTEGEQLRSGPSWRFDTAGMSDPGERFAQFAREGVAGDMVYGLFRASALASAGFPRALAPDRLLLARLSLIGEFHQVEEVLWRRRYVVKVSSRRQRAAFFPEGAPAWSHVPWPLAHFAALARDLPHAPGAPAGRLAALAMAARYLAASTWRQARKQLLRPVGAASRLRRRVAGTSAGAGTRPLPPDGGCHPVGRSGSRSGRPGPWKR